MSTEKVTIHTELTPDNLAACLADPLWRLFNLYKILIKGDDEDLDADEDVGLVLQFKPNRAQRRFLMNLHTRNLILKSRQLGFTTEICILWLDYALFTANVRCAIIAHTLGDAQAIFRDKVKFAYDNLPDIVRETVPLVRDSMTELLFAHNNSSVRVATSVRSGTVHRLHVSEYGKICARQPMRASEIETGSFPAVPANGVIVVESTSEGRAGQFYDMVQRAKAKRDAGRMLTAKDWRLHFFAWHDDPKNRMDPEGIIITPEDHAYFDKLEPQIDKELDLEQRAWYVTTRDNDFSGSDAKMWQEHPSTEDEAFQKNSEGTYYWKEIAAMRRSGRLVQSLPEIDIPVNTFWDIGGTAGTAIWFHQQVGAQHRFIDYYEAHGEPYAHFIRILNEKNYLYNKHFLPHDADHERQGKESNDTPRIMLEELGLRRIEIVPVVSSLEVGIELMRQAFPQLWIDETKCAKGVERLENYKRKWDTQQATWRPEPEKHDGNSEAADAARQFAQALREGLITLAAAAPMRRRVVGSWKTR